jgi:hypothetical protein
MLYGIGTKILFATGSTSSNMTGKVIAYDPNTNEYEIDFGDNNIKYFTEKKIKRLTANRQRSRSRSRDRGIERPRSQGGKRKTKKNNRKSRRSR